MWLRVSYQIGHLCAIMVIKKQNVLNNFFSKESPKNLIKWLSFIFLNVTAIENIFFGGRERLALLRNVGRFNISRCSTIYCNT